MNTGTETTRNGNKRTLLVVDDQPENLSLMGEILGPHFQVRVANSGARALAACASTPRPELVLLDVMMPVMDGYEVLKLLKDNEATRDIPVIFVTALSDTEDETVGLQLGAVDYITKPVRPAILLARVQAHLLLKEAHDRLSEQNLWLEAEVQRRMKQNQMIQDVTIRALASLAETRDKETGAHILRTQHYVRVLAEQMAKLPQYARTLTAASIDAMTKAAPLHDIGKVGIPDQILHKPGKHTPEEWEIMKTHAKLGSDAIWQAIAGEEDFTGLDFLYVAMEIAHFHHEKWDGSGYPEGRAGNSIPLSARIMALADVFDALLSRRVYKASFPMDEVLSIIRSQRGKHFDPELIDAFEVRLDDLMAIARRYPDSEAPTGHKD